MGIDLGQLFSKGIDAYKDIEVSKNYAANDARPGTRTADGSAVPQGVDGSSTNETISSFAKSHGLAVGLVLVVALVFLVARR